MPLCAQKEAPTVIAPVRLCYLLRNAVQIQSMEEAKIEDKPAGPDGLLTLKQCENLLK
jgi:hypothetical protein